MTPEMELNVVPMPGSNLMLPLLAGEPRKAAQAWISQEAAGTGEHTLLSQDAARRKSGTTPVASWELALCTRSEQSRLSQ